MSSSHQMRRPMQAAQGDELHGGLELRLVALCIRKLGPEVRSTAAPQAGLPHSRDLS